MNIALIDDSNEDMIRLSSHIKQFFMNKQASIPLRINFYQDEDHFIGNFKKYHYDIIFVDYFLKTLTGIELARKIRILDNMAALIFTTVSRDFAIDSYRVKASGYLVKPIEYHDFQETMELIDCRRMLKNRFIEIKNGMTVKQILLKDIIYCDVSGHYTRIHTKDMGVIKCRQSFMDFEKCIQIYPEFLTCYRGCIINMSEVKRIEELGFLMTNGERIPVRTKQRSEIINRYTDFIFEKNRRGRYNFE